MQQTGILGIQVPPATQPNPLRVTAWVDHQDNTYAFGEQVQLYVQTNKDGLRHRAQRGSRRGRRRSCFRTSTSRTIGYRANTVVRVPDPASGTAITVSGPVGAELIKVIASTRAAAAVRCVAAWLRRGPFRAAVDEFGCRHGACAAGWFWRIRPAASGTTYNKAILTVPQRQAAAVAGGPTVVTWPAPAFGLRLAATKSQYRLTEPVTLMVEAGPHLPSDADQHRADRRLSSDFPEPLPAEHADSGGADGGGAGHERRRDATADRSGWYRERDRHLHRWRPARPPVS